MFSSLFFSAFESAQKSFGNVSGETIQTISKLSDSAKKTTVDLAQQLGNQIGLTATSPAAPTTQSKPISLEDLFTLPSVGEGFGLSSVFGEREVEKWIYKENFAAGTGMLTKYTMYLNKIGQHNRILARKAELANDKFKTGALFTVNTSNELRAFREQTDAMPKLINEINMTSKKVELLCARLADLEKLLTAKVQATVDSQILVSKTLIDEAVHQERRQMRTTLAEVEQKLKETEQRMISDEQQKRHTKEQVEKEETIKVLEKQIDEQIEDYAVYGAISKAPVKSEGVNLEQIHLDTSGHDELSSFLGDDTENNPSQENKENPFLDEDQSETDAGPVVHVLEDEEMP